MTEFSSFFREQVILSNSVNCSYHDKLWIIILNILDCKAGENHCTRTYDECTEDICGKCGYWYNSPWLLLSFESLNVIIIEDFLKTVFYFNVLVSFSHKKTYW